MSPNAKLTILRTLLIVMAGCWVFGPALRGDWLMDDDLYLTQNALMNDPARLWKIWFAPGSLIEYYPIEASLQAIEWRLWHTDTAGYHLVNLALHLVGSVLVWRLLEKFGLRLAWLGGLLFAVHPAVVESVAWISEFKNVLSLPPFLLAMCVWIDYAERRRKQDYFLSLGLFTIAMLCKISMVLFPLVLLLFAWWKRDRIGWKDVKEVAPFLVVSVVLGATTLLVGDWFRHVHHQTEHDLEVGGYASKLALSGTAISFYLWNFLWPVGLLPIYPKWTVDPPSPVEFLPWLAMIGAASWFWTKRKGWGRQALLGFGFFLINLLPFVGFHAPSYMGISWVMDHFLYLPMVGLVGLTIAVLEQAENRLPASKQAVSTGAIAVVIGALAWDSHAYAGRFIGQETLWTYTLEHNPGAWLAHNNLGNIMLVTGRTAEAIEHYQKALQIAPDGVEAHNNLGMALRMEHRPEEAMVQFQAALKSNPNFATGHRNLGDTLCELGRTAEAIDQYRQALIIEPSDDATRKQVARLEAQEKADPERK